MPSRIVTDTAWFQRNLQRLFVRWERYSGVRSATFLIRIYYNVLGKILVNPFKFGNKMSISTTHKTFVNTPLPPAASKTHPERREVDSSCVFRTEGITLYAYTQLLSTTVTSLCFRPHWNCSTTRPSMNAKAIKYLLLL